MLEKRNAPAIVISEPPAQTLGLARSISPRSNMNIGMEDMEAGGVWLEEDFEGL
jgi:hypothetical protein